MHVLSTMQPILASKSIFGHRQMVVYVLIFFLSANQSRDIRNPNGNNYYYYYYFRFALSMFVCVVCAISVHFDFRHCSNLLYVSVIRALENRSSEHDASTYHTLGELDGLAKCFGLLLSPSISLVFIHSIWSSLMWPFVLCVILISNERSSKHDDDAVLLFYFYRISALWFISFVIAHVIVHQKHQKCKWRIISIHAHSKNS